MMELLPLVILIVGIFILRGYNLRIKRLETRVQELQNALAGRVLMADAGESVDVTEPAIAAAAGPAAAIQEPPTEAAIKEPTAAGIEEPAIAARNIPDALTDGTLTDDGPDIAAREAPQPRESLESTIGARWAVWVGGIALALGGIFMVKYSIESGLLSPGVRLVLAAIFGLILVAAGEIIRRRSAPVLGNAFQNAMIPGVLTAAGVVALFGSTYAAHGIYGFIGPATAFVLLGLISLATLALSLQHGQALAGLGLLASMVTPALIASTAPQPWVLFGYLVLTWLATLLASRLRRWLIAPSFANALLSLWPMLYVAYSEVVDFTPVTLSMLAMIGGTIFIWPGRFLAATAAKAADGIGTEMAADPMQLASTGGWGAFLARPPLGMTLTASIGALAVSLHLLTYSLQSGYPIVDAMFMFAAIVAAVAAFGAGRIHAGWAAILSAVVAVVGVSGVLTNWIAGVEPKSADGIVTMQSMVLYESLGIGAIFVLVGAFFLRRFAEGEKPFAALWSLIMAATPLAIATISFINFGNWTFDWLHGLYGVGLGIVLMALAEWQHRRSGEGLNLPTNILAAGSFGAMVFALHMFAHDAAPTILLPVLGIAYVSAARLRDWPVLPWTMVAALIITMARIAWQPTIVDPSELGTTPVFNMLLAGYGIPAALAALAAFTVRHSSSVRLRNTLQALASFLVLLTIAILVRHAMNGGVLNDAVPTLGEQSIYTLLAIGASAMLMTLDLSAASPVFRYGSMALGTLSVILTLTLHLLGLNPFITGESTGRIPLFNLLLLGYLLPAIAYGGLALYARNRRPLPYVSMLAVAGAVMALAWATLSVRRLWQGEYIPFWNGFIQGELYSYSVVWLLIGIALLGLGARFEARSLRIASAALVFIAVVKAFLIDMANLEGFLRALSFIGLGAVLIGIGLFYQKILTRKKTTG
ncbi:putative membrane protein [Rhizobium sp. SG741]|nr:putative membrane protein [Rhizobium sp. SG741]